MKTRQMKPRQSPLTDQGLESLDAFLADPVREDTTMDMAGAQSRRIALRLARYFGTSEAFWMGLQADYDLEEARERLGNRLEREVGRHAA